MSKHYITQYAIDEVSFIYNFLKNNITDYKLSELTGNHVGDLPNIVRAHPLAMEYGELISSSDPENYTSILPAIGVEMINDNETSQQFLGQGYKIEEITQDYIDQIELLNMDDRRESGNLLADKNLTDIKNAKANALPDKLYSRTKMYMQDQTVAISIWSDHPDITRITYLVIRSLLKRLKINLSKSGVKNLRITGQGAIYNYEFNRTLYGNEFNLTFINSHKDVEIDTDIITINTVEDHLTKNETGGQFVSVGKNDEPYPEKN